MIIRIVSMLVLLIASSCGILGINKPDVDPDPDFQSRAIAALNNKKIAKEMDSLITKIDAAPSSIPANLNQTTLIVETYQYTDFLKMSENKFHTPKDDKQNRRYYERYRKKCNSLISRPKYRTIYVDKGKYDAMDSDQFRYVLKTTNRINYDPEHIFVTNDGFVHM